MTGLLSGISHEEGDSSSYFPERSDNYEHFRGRDDSYESLGWYIKIYTYPFEYIVYLKLWFLMIGKISTVFDVVHSLENILLK